MKLSWGILLSGILACKANPVSKARRTFENRTVDISPAQLDDFKYFAQYAAAAYCTNNVDNIPSPISCSDNVCPAITTANALTVLEFNYGQVGDANVFGFVATDPGRSLIVVSFRGSDSIRNWIANVLIRQCETSICSGCKLHVGFSKAWEERQAVVVAAVNGARAAHPSYKLILAGHSLGAAVATIAGAYFRSIGINVDIYTYGSPRVGNDEFVNYVSSTTSGSIYRITHLNDPVPHLPLGGSIAWLTGYYHTSPEYWLANGTPTTDDYSIGDVKVCEGINNQNCAGSEGAIHWNSEAHGHYFQPITACDPAFTFRS